MLLDQLVATSERVGATRSRLAKVRELADFLRALAPGEVEVAVGCLTGAPRQGRLGIGYAAVSQAAAPPKATPALSLSELDDALTRLSECRGPGSGALRAQLLHGLLARATAREQDFLRRLLLGELRQGAVEGVMVEAIAAAAAVSAAAVRRAAMLCGDLAEVARAALAGGAAALGGFSLQLRRPLQPMLAQTAADPAAALASLRRAAFEWKLDGARVQVHREGDRIAVFTRHLNEVTEALPEVVEAVAALPAQRLVLDGEVLALKADGRPHSFQTTMRRFGRRRDVAALRAELPLRAFFFDCLHVEGSDLLDAPAAERVAALASAVPAELVVPRLVTADAAAAEAFLAAALERGHEGVVAKALDAPYEAGRRGASWLKIKPAHSLDLVVLAAEWGSGRRRGFLSNLHLGARDAEAGGFVMLGKTFKGLTDELLAWQTARLLELEVGRDGNVVYVRPELVVEIAFDGVQRSPHYPGGIALRFARVKRYRPDKAAADADTLQALRARHGG